MMLNKKKSFVFFLLILCKTTFFITAESEVSYQTDENKEINLQESGTGTKLIPVECQKAVTIEVNKLLSGLNKKNILLVVGSIAWSGFWWMYTRINVIRAVDGMKK